MKKLLCFLGLHDYSGFRRAQITIIGVDQNNNNVTEKMSIPILICKRCDREHKYLLPKEIRNIISWVKWNILRIRSGARRIKEIRVVDNKDRIDIG